MKVWGAGRRRRAPKLKEVQAARRRKDLSQINDHQWLRGYAAALAAVQRLYDVPAVVKGVMNGDGLTVEAFKAAGVENFDLDRIKEAK